MKIHEVLCLKRLQISYRSVSCCSYLCDEKKFDCSCFDLKEFAFENPPVSDTHVPSQYIEGRYCIVLYDDKLYPGLILHNDMQGSVQVNCMKPFGRNRYFWPSAKDINWYSLSDCLAIIEEPVKKGSRRPYFSVDEKILSELEKRFV